jgi:hypothetical protein
LLLKAAYKYIRIYLYTYAASLGPIQVYPPFVWRVYPPPAAKIIIPPGYNNFAFYTLIFDLSLKPAIKARVLILRSPHPKIDAQHHLNTLLLKALYKYIRIYLYTYAASFKAKGGHSAFLF